MEDPQFAAAAAWEESAPAYIAFQDRRDPNRTILLDPEMLRLCGDVEGRRVLDLGCGEGRFCRMLAERGARTAGLDLTPQMVRTAAERDAGHGSYMRAGAERLPLRSGTFDLIVSYVTLVDITGYREAIAEAARVLRPGGRLVVANLGFVTASAGWLRDEQGRRLYHRVDRYADEWSRELEWAGMRIVNWHRPLANYMQAYLGAGLVLREFLEPVPTDESLRENEEFEDWFRVPFFTVMRWDKP
ncbi:MAG TPA: class I SAM-dependent methyltransferase [Dehalococcoidia bacterium]|jgi:SAM-dependent methyltransferase|nr:class I SAM-dependent methyltransferase [Dehalococcoidia bacterium]